MQTLYGLPERVEFCRLCGISNQRPNSVVEFRHTPESVKATIHFEDGVCDACRTAARKKQTNWQDREHQLRALCDKFRGCGKYDCLVPGSGGKDSFYAAHRLKYDFGMSPLTVTWAPHLYTDWGWHNFQQWIHAGFDNYLCTPNGKTHRLLTRLAVENLLHPFQPFMIGQKNIAPKMAALFGIPLVFYGENEAEYGNPCQDGEKATRDWRYFTAENENVYLGGTSVKDLRFYWGLTDADLDPYLPINPETAKGIEVHYLGYYLPWHPQGAYYYCTKHADWHPSPERTPGTYSKYNSIDDKIDDFHYFTTFIKFGIGRATYDASQEVRSGDITRDEAVALIRRYDGEYPERFEKEVFQYLSVDGFPKMDRGYFLALCERFKSPHLWDGDKLRHRVI